MRRHKQLTLCMSALTLVALGQVNALDLKKAGPRDLLLRIEVPKRVVALYETVQVNYSVRNPTDQTITATVEMRYSQHAIKFSITDPEGNTEPYFAGPFEDGVLSDTVHLPGSVLNSETEMGVAAFPKPGKYTIHATMGVGVDSGPAILKAEPVEIEVKAPGGSEAQAMEFFSSREEFLRLIQRGPRVYCEEKETSAPRCFEELSRFLQQSSDSAYAPWIAWSLAETIASGGLKVVPRYDSAIGLLRRFLEKWPDHPAAPRVMYNLAFVLHDAGRKEEAIETIDAFEKKYPNRPDLVELLRGNLQHRK
jgi:tetratricopeptide repeat protein